MKKTPNIKWSGYLQQETLTSQKPDAEGLKRFSQEIGKITMADGSSHWTNFKIYSQEPNFDYPLNVKISMQNPAGKAFTELTLRQFDDLICDILNWRLSQDKIYNDLSIKEKRLNIRRKVHEHIKALLSQPCRDLPDLQLNGESIYEQTIHSIKDKLYDAIDRLRFSDNDKQKFALKNYISKLIETLPEESDQDDMIQYMKEKLNTIG